MSPPLRRILSLEEIPETKPRMVCVRVREREREREEGRGMNQKGRRAWAPGQQCVVKPFGFLQATTQTTNPSGSPRFRSIVFQSVLLLLSISLSLSPHLPYLFLQPSVPLVFASHIGGRQHTERQRRMDGWMDGPDSRIRVSPRILGLTLCQPATSRHPSRHRFRNQIPRRRSWLQLVRVRKRGLLATLAWVTLLILCTHTHTHTPKGCLGQAASHRSDGFVTSSRVVAVVVSVV